MPAPPPNPGSESSGRGRRLEFRRDALPERPRLDPSTQFITSVVKASIQSLENPNANMSSAILDEPPEQPKIAVDPMMAEGAAAGPRA